MPISSANGVSTSTVSVPGNTGNNEVKKSLFRQVVRDTVIEVCALAVITQICSRYAATPQLKTYFIRKAVTVAGTNFLVRSVAALLSCLKDKHTWMEYAHLASDLLSSANFAFRFHMFTTNPLIHECGHAAAWFLLYKGVKVQIIAESVNHWVTKMIPLGDFSFPENYVGYSRSIFIILAAGSTMSLIAANSAIIFSANMVKSYPKISAYLLFSALATIKDEFFYSLERGNNTDFNKLWKLFGVHPLAAAAFMIVSFMITGKVCVSFASRKLQSCTNTDSSSVQ